MKGLENWCSYNLLRKSSGKVNAVPVSEAKKRANAKYTLKAYDRIELKVAKGRKADLQEHAANQGESLNGFVNRAIDEAVDRDKRSCYR